MKPKEKPIPTRFDPVEGELLKFFADEKGLSDSDTIRRSVRLLLREIERRGPNWDWVGETARPIDGATLIKLKKRRLQQPGNEAGHGQS